MKGRILRSTGSWYKILSEGKLYDGRLRGKLRTLDLKSTNPIAVGDWVEFVEEEDGTVNIEDIVKRENYIIRKSTRLHAQSHILAANIDQAVLVVSLKQPRTSLGFIDRFLVLTESFRIPTTIIFNKIDLLKEKQMPLLEEYFSIYSSLEYRCEIVSMKEERGVEILDDVFKGKTSLIAGHSGVGKSTVLNYLNPNLELKTNEISKFSNKGKHTTTFVEMHDVGDDTFIIDSPGIKELGFVDIQKQEVSHYFVEFRELLNACKFHNCTHEHEPDCAVMAAVEEEIIHPARYYNYLSIIRGEDFKDK